MTRMSWRADRRGFTLIELVIAMVVVAVALSGVLMVMNYTVQHSADPMLERQAVAIAEAYLEEVLLRAYNDPDGDDTGETRATWDDVDDYNGLHDVGARDQRDAAIGGLEAYTVNVTVTPTPLSGQAAKEVTVTVRHASGINLRLKGFRTSYY